MSLPIKRAVDLLPGLLAEDPLGAGGGAPVAHYGRPLAAAGASSPPGAGGGGGLEGAGGPPGAGGEV